MANYSYNGVILPEIPFREDYPNQCAILVKDSGVNVMCTVFHTKKPVYLSNNFVGDFQMIVQSSEETYIHMTYAFEESEAGWQEETTHTAFALLMGPGVSGTSEYSVPWTNNNILNGSSEIYLAASDPIPYIEASAATIRVDESCYTELGDICRARLQVDTKWKPSELPDAIRSLAPLKDASIDRSKIINGVVYYPINDSDTELIGDVMTPGCCTGMTLPNLSSISGRHSTIADYAYAACTIGSYSHTDFTIEEGVTAIGKYAFYDCKMQWMDGIVFPNGLVTIGECAFADTTGLSTNCEIVLPNSLVTLGERAFKGCDAISYVVPSSITSMGYWVFYGNEYLEKVDFAANISELPYGLFFSCAKLETLILRKSNYAYTCHTDSYLNLLSSGCPICKGTGYIYVPSALIDTYKANENWSGIAAQFRAIEDYPDICGTV